jgi:ribonuclease HII
MTQMMAKHRPSFDEELTLWSSGFEFVVGVDEVGRGAFAGPVVAAAVIFPKSIITTNDPLLKDINDSKLLLPKKRQQLVTYITSVCLFSSIATIPVATINKIGIGKAAHIAFRKVLADTCRTFDSTKLYALIDGFGIPYARVVNKSRQKALIKGDRRSVSIAAASIIAKVYRDRLMEKYHTQFAEYNFAQNKGYGTKEHRNIIRMNGLCKLHRTSFNLQRFLPTSS